MFQLFVQSLFLLHVFALPVFQPIDILGIIEGSQIAQLNNQPYTGPNQVQTTQQFEVLGGVLQRNCQVNLQPIVANGLNLVEETRQCTDTFIASSATGSGFDPSSTQSGQGSISSGTSSSIFNTTTTASSFDPTATTISGSDGQQGQQGLNTVPSLSSSAPPEVVTPPTATSSDTSVFTPPPQVVSQSQNTDPLNSVAAATGSVATLGGSVPTIGQDNSPTPAGTAAASSSSAAFQLPGKKLQVLPIGLGVFAGISVIALIVVGLVTYERTKYRKTFRQRRLATEGADMGYGGMAERR